MCRFLVYKGSEEILLSKIITNPSHSILNQSFDSRLRLDTRRPHNGDGFGIGYYTDIKLGPEPCIFTSTIPAWNCINLERIASKTASSLIFAHVRATTEGSLSDDNCHPFSHGTLMWMQNGGLGGWKHIKRRLGEKLQDRWYNKVQGSTDTEWAFALFLNTLETMGYDPSNTPTDGFGPTVIRAALLKTIEQINQLIKDIPEQIVREGNVDCRSLLNFAISDGHTVVCSRYVSSKNDEAASLYYSSGTSWDDKTDGNYHMDRKDKGADVVLVASEPLTFERDNWVTVPTNSTITIHKQTVMVHPILDEYYNHSPDFKRSSKLVISKGLDSSEKTPTPAVTPGDSSFNSTSSFNAQAEDPYDSAFSTPNSRNGILVSSPMMNVHAMQNRRKAMVRNELGSPLMRPSYFESLEDDASEDNNSALSNEPQSLTLAGDTLVSSDRSELASAVDSSPVTPRAIDVSTVLHFENRRTSSQSSAISQTLSIPPQLQPTYSYFEDEDIDQSMSSEDSEEGGVPLLFEDDTIPSNSRLH